MQTLTNYPLTPEARTAARLRELLILLPWYAQQDQAFGIEYWHALLWRLLNDPMTELREGAKIVPAPIQEAARRLA